MDSIVALRDELLRDPEFLRILEIQHLEQKLKKKQQAISTYSAFIDKWSNLLSNLQKQNSIILDRSYVSAQEYEKSKSAVLSPSASASLSAGLTSKGYTISHEEDTMEAPWTSDLKGEMIDTPDSSNPVSSIGSPHFDDGMDDSDDDLKEIERQEAETTDIVMEFPGEDDEEGQSEDQNSSQDTEKIGKEQEQKSKQEEGTMQDKKQLEDDDGGLGANIDFGMFW